MSLQLVILDRDGVINQDAANHVRSEAQWHALTGSLEAITRLNQAGFKVAVATNQSGIKRKLFSAEELNRIHAKLYRQLADLGGHIEALAICPHGPKDNCGCRKPRSGLLELLANKLRVAQPNAVFIGDKLTDVQAAQSCGMRRIFVRSGLRGNADEAAAVAAGADAFDDLAQAADWIIANES